MVRAGDDGPPLVISSLLLRPGATIGESLTEQAGQTQRLGPNFGEAGDEEWVAAIGMGRAEATARILSLVLYLCSDDSDVTRREVPTAVSPRRVPGGAETVVMSAGFRLGAALRLPPPSTPAPLATVLGTGWRHICAGPTGITSGPAARPAVIATSGSTGYRP